MKSQGESKINRIAQIVVVVVIFTIVNIVCNEKRISPEETLQRYFDFWNNKNLNGMKSLTTEQNIDYQLERLEYVKLNKVSECSEAINKCNNDIVNHLNKKPYQTRFFCINFDFKYKEGMSGPMSSGNYNWSFLLIKENRKSKWIIKAYGWP